MLDGMALVDAHVHVPRLSTLKPAWRDWAERFAGGDWRSVYNSDGDPRPAVLDELFEAEGVDRALLFCASSRSARWR